MWARYTMAYSWLHREFIGSIELAHNKGLNNLARLLEVIKKSWADTGRVHISTDADTDISVKDLDRLIDCFIQMGYDAVYKFGDGGISVCWWRPY